MLRKIKSKSFLSPGKTSKLASPSTSPNKVQTRQHDKTEALSDVEEHIFIASSPCRVSTPLQENPTCKSESQAEKVGHHVASLIATCQALIHTPNDCDALPDHEKDGKIRGLRRRASAWLGLTPNHESSVGLARDANLDIALKRTTNLKEEAESHCRLLALYAELRCEYSSASGKAQEMLLLVDLKAYLPGLQSRSTKSSPLRMIVILDNKQNVLRHGHSPRQCSIALRVVQNLEANDHVGILTTTVGYDKQRVLSDLHLVGHSGKRVLTELICNFSLESQFEETDVAASLRHALRLLDTSDLHESHIVFISDGCSQLVPEELAQVQHALQSARVRLHVIPTQTFADLHSLRSLAHSASNGTLLPSGDAKEVSALLQSMRSGHNHNFLTHMEVHLQLYDGASFLGIRNEEVTVKSASEHDLILRIEHFGAQETRQIILAIGIPAVSLPKEPQRKEKITLSRSVGVSEDDTLDNSFRLAELDHIVRSMPGKLVTMQVSYHHPYLVDEARICLASKTLALKRTNAVSHEPDAVIRSLDARQNSVKMLHLAQSYARSGQTAIARYYLKKIETDIHSFCIQYKISHIEFEDIIMETSLQKSQFRQDSARPANGTHIPEMPRNVTKALEPCESKPKPIRQAERTEAYVESRMQLNATSASDFKLLPSLATTKACSKPPLIRQDETLDIYKNFKKCGASDTMVVSQKHRKPLSNPGFINPKFGLTLTPRGSSSILTNRSAQSTPPHNMRRLRSDLDLRRVASARGYRIERSDHADERSLRLTDRDVVDHSLQSARDETDCSRQRTEQYVSDQINRQCMEDHDRAKCIWKSQKVERGELSICSLELDEQVDMLQICKEPDMVETCEVNLNTSILDRLDRSSNQGGIPGEEVVILPLGDQQIQAGIIRQMNHITADSTSQRPSSTYSTAAEQKACESTE